MQSEVAIPTSQELEERLFKAITTSQTCKGTSQYRRFFSIIAPPTNLTKFSSGRIDTTHSCKLSLLPDQIKKVELLGVGKSVDGVYNIRRYIAGIIDIKVLLDAQITIKGVEIYAFMTSEPVNSNMLVKAGSDAIPALMVHDDGGWAYHRLVDHWNGEEEEPTPTPNQMVNCAYASAQLSRKRKGK